MKLKICNIYNKKAHYIESEVIYIKDKNLQKLINRALDKGDTLKEVMKEEIESLMKLEIFNSDVKDISGLEHAINLKDLRLMIGKAENISLIENLVNLEKLDLSNSNIDDIAFLKKLTNLKQLDLTGNNLEDISPIKDLINLEKLILSKNKIKDVESFKNLSKLKELYLSDNSLEDVSVLRHLKSIEILSLNSNNIRNVGFLSELTNIKELYMKQNRIENIDSLRFLVSLKKLNLDNNHIKDVSMLRHSVLYENYRILKQDVYISSLNDIKLEGFGFNPMKIKMLEDYKISNGNPNEVVIGEFETSEIGICLETVKLMDGRILMSLNKD